VLKIRGGGEMVTITEFEPDFARAFPALCETLKNGPLVIHDAVSRVTLHGSRGPAGGFEENSDIDLCLIVDSEQYPNMAQDEELLKEIIYTPLAEWRGTLKLDLRVNFDLRKCGLKCFDECQYKAGICTGGGLDCFGIYEIEDGQPLYVINSSTNVKSIYPCVLVWKRDGKTRGLFF
jgi:hypothetical protein